MLAHQTLLLAKRLCCLPKNIFSKSLKISTRLSSTSSPYPYPTLKPLQVPNNESIGGLEEIEYYGHKKQTPVSLKALMETGKGERLNRDNAFVSSNGHTQSADAISSLMETAKRNDQILIQVACFLHRELPIRLAHRVVELQGSPLFMKSEHIKNVCNWYKTSFSQLRRCPAPSSKDKEIEFAKIIESIYERHSSTLITMAKGAHQLRSYLGQDINQFAELHDTQKRLDDFYMSRIGIRMLIGQYLALRKPVPDESMIGLVSQVASPYDIAQQVIDDAAYMCSRQHGDAPEVTIHGRTDLHFPYVSSHINYIMLELLKNSMRATVETHGIDKMPPIRIIIADGEDNEDVVIKISDEGGGIRRSNMNRIWSYLFTTANPGILEGMLSDEQEAVRDFDTASPLAGLGYGLPISRNYARYFGGDMTIMSMEGYGTDSFIYLPRLGDQWCRS